MNEIPEFGIKRDNEERRDGGCGIVFDPETKKFAVGKLNDKDTLRFFSGGVDANEDLHQGILREVTEESGLCDFEKVEQVAQVMTHYYNSLRNVNRVAMATCLLIILKSKKIDGLKLEEHEKFSMVWATAEEIIENLNKYNGNKDNDHWLYFMDKALARLKEQGY